jgi:hypothetical protein
MIMIRSSSQSKSLKLPQERLGGFCPRLIGSNWLPCILLIAPVAPIALVLNVKQGMYFLNRQIILYLKRLCCALNS